MNSNTLPLVTIITPVYNGSDYLDDLIKSVQAQDYPNIEHIIIDDGSTDNGETVGILSKYPHIRWWTRTNRGQYATMNEGLYEAKGEIVCFISADDIMCSDAVTISVSNLVESSELDGVYGTYGYINKSGKKLNYFHPMKIMPTSMYPYSLHISHSSLFVRKSSLLKNDLIFNASLRYVGDYDWIVRLLKNKLSIRKISFKLSMIRIHDHQSSKKSFYNMREETFTLQNDIGVSKLKASIFRKFWFFINLINSLFFEGLGASLELIDDRIRKNIS